MLPSNSSLTRLHQVLHGGEPLVDGRAHRAIDEHAGQVGVAHQGPPGQPGRLVSPPDVSAYQGCQAVRPGDVLKLAPPAGDHQGHIETWFGKKELPGEVGCCGIGGSVFFWLQVKELTQHKGHRDELGVVVAVNGELLKKPPLIIFKY